MTWGPLEPGHARAIQRLEQHVHHERAGALFVVACKPTALTDVVAARLSAGGRPFVALQLSAESQPWVEIRKGIQGLAQPIVLVRLPEETPENAKALRDLWHRLNMGREALQRLDMRLVLVVPGLDAMGGFRSRAPDLWAIRRLVLQLPTAEDFLVAGDPSKATDRLDKAQPINRLWDAVYLAVGKDQSSIVQRSHVLRTFLTLQLTSSDTAGIVWQSANSDAGTLASRKVGQRFSAVEAFELGSRYVANDDGLRPKWRSARETKHGPWHQTVCIANLVSSLLGERRTRIAEDWLLRVAPLHLQIDEEDCGRSSSYHDANLGQLWTQRDDPRRALSHFCQSVYTRITNGSGCPTTVSTRPARQLMTRLGLAEQGQKIVEAGLTLPSIEAIVEARQLARGDRSVNLEALLWTLIAEASDARRGVRHRAQCCLEIARTCVWLSSDDPTPALLQRGHVALEQLEHLPRTMKLVADSKEMDAFKVTSDDPVESAIAHLWAQRPQGLSFSARLNDDTELPEWADFEVDPVGELWADAQLIRAQLHALTGDIDAATACLEPTYAWLTENSLPLQHAKIRAAHAKLLNDADRPQEVLPLVERAHALLDDQWIDGVDVRPVQTLIDLDVEAHRALLALGKPKAAASRLDGLLKLVDDAGFYAGRPPILDLVTRLPNEARSLPERLKVAKTMRRLAIESGFLDDQARAWMALARLHAEAGQREDAALAERHASELVDALNWYSLRTELAEVHDAMQACTSAAEREAAEG